MDLRDLLHLENLAGRYRQEVLAGHVDLEKNLVGLQGQAALETLQDLAGQVDQLFRVGLLHQEDRHGLVDQLDQLDQDHQVGLAGLAGMNLVCLADR